MRDVSIDDDSKPVRVRLAYTSLSHGYGPVQQDEEDSVRVVHRALDLGISHASVGELDRINGQFPFSAVQYELAVLAWHNLDDVLQWCETTATPFPAFSPLGRGLLTGQADHTALDEKDARSRDPRFDEHTFAANRTIVDGLTRAAHRHGARRVSNSPTRTRGIWRGARRPSGATHGDYARSGS